MNYSESKIGQIYSIDKQKKVGYIISNGELYMFTVNDIIGDIDNLNINDFVKFRGEVVNNILKAFFVKNMDKISLTLKQDNN